MTVQSEFVQEGLREVTTEKSSYKVQLDRSNSLWTISTVTGPVPVALRGRYTSAKSAELAIKNYVDQAPLRAATYSNKKKEG